MPRPWCTTGSGNRLYRRRKRWFGIGVHLADPFYKLYPEYSAGFAGLAESGAVALDILQISPIDVILLDLRMQGLSGSETLRRIGETGSEARTIVISSFEYDEEIYEAVKAGAQGFVHKEATAEDILYAIRSVAKGRQSFPKHIMERLESDEMSAGLSARQIEVLQLVARGLTNKEVAKILNLRAQFAMVYSSRRGNVSRGLKPESLGESNVRDKSRTYLRSKSKNCLSRPIHLKEHRSSQFTVRNHLNHITQKLEATDRTEAIFIALQIGLISPP